jgi:DNA mismatch repair protein MutS2
MSGRLSIIFSGCSGSDVSLQRNDNGVDKHSLEVLEFPKIVALTAARTQSAPGRELVEDLAPLSEAESIETELRWTGELREVVAVGAGVPSLSFPDVRPHLEKVRVEGSVLEPMQLREIGQFLSTVEGTLRFVKERRETCPLCFTCAGEIRTHRQLRKKIEDSIDPSGELLDSASPTLRSLRRDIERNREKARDLLTGFLKSLGSPLESFSTLRNDRYMVLIPAQSRKKLKGIVHDQSASGAGIYFEPLQAVDVNNSLSKLSAEEKEEKLRIMRELSSLVRDCVSELDEALGKLATLDSVFARARLSNELEAVRPAISTDGAIRLRAARHPILLLQGRERGFDVEPLDLEMGSTFKVLLISGPNMGGKTVALKTVGLLSLMMRCGLHVPAGQDTALPVSTSLFCDIGDEQSIEEQLSTFASHMRQVAKALDRAEVTSLVLIDELGAGTDPVEGAALSESVLEELERKGALSVATTHLGSLKNFVASREGMRNASMAFDPETGRPLYRLEVGIPGQSRALETALRMGIARDVIDRARACLSTEEREMSSLLVELEVIRRDVQAEKETLRNGKRRVSELIGQYEERITKFDEEKRDLRARAAREARGLLAEARNLIRNVKEELKGAEKRPGRVSELKRVVEDADARLSEEEHPAPEVSSLEPSLVGPGMTVWAYDINSVATVVAPPDSEGRVKVERKGVRIDTHVSRLGRAPGEEEPTRQVIVIRSEGDDGFSASLDIRGSMVDEALDSLEKYLDGALLRGLSQVTIIHGKGKGILREKVQEALNGFPFVKGYRLGELSEGGVGVTVVELST